MRGKIPWHIPGDMQHFFKITTTTRDAQKENAIIMGRNTWDSLPQKPLSKRRNVIISNSSQDWHGQEVYPSLQTALEVLWRESNIENIFVIGGQKLYEEAIHHPACKYAYVTTIGCDFECDTFFPFTEFYHNDWEIASVGPVLKTIDDISYVFYEYKRTTVGA